MAGLQFPLPCNPSHKGQGHIWRFLQLQRKSHLFIHSQGNMLGRQVGFARWGIMSKLKLSWQNEHIYEHVYKQVQSWVLTHIEPQNSVLLYKFTATQTSRNILFSSVHSLLQINVPLITLCSTDNPSATFWYLSAPDYLFIFSFLLSNQTSWTTVVNVFCSYCFTKRTHSEWKKIT